MSLAAITIRCARRVRRRAGSRDEEGASHVAARAGGTQLQAREKKARGEQEHTRHVQ
jgi:hypothetical protein